MQKPIAIFRHAEQEGPGYLTTFLDENGIPWRLIAIDLGDSIPASANGWSGLAFMGGPMSVNDDLPWIKQSLELIRNAVLQDIPVIGHCLGGQLMSKALGGSITLNPVKEIGWGQVLLESTAPDLGLKKNSFKAFHWHGETFSIPEKAQRILTGEFCINQGFILGKHLGFQCHIEMTEEMVKEWYEIGKEEVETCPLHPAVQPFESIKPDLITDISELQKVAKQIYSYWIKGVKH